MKDDLDTKTEDLLQEPKRPVGRPLKDERKRTQADIMTAQREKIRLQITTQNPNNWDFRTCCLALTNSKFKNYREFAWKRYGEILGFENK